MGGITGPPPDITALLLAWGHGDPAALDRLIPHVHNQLHQIAQRCAAGERVGQSLQATALINEAYLRLVDTKAITLKDRAHFFALAARVMRRILIDRARARRAEKRGGLAARVTFDEGLLVTDEPGHELVALDDALEALAKFDERKSRVIEMRFFGGLSVEETASVLGVSPDTVMRDWRLAKAWLEREMDPGSNDA
jgi:RNA polymerase sigma-70 factor, ECF subfamily